jgi:hypothetical protein
MRCRCAFLRLLGPFRPKDSNSPALRRCVILGRAVPRLNVTARSLVRAASAYEFVVRRTWRP